MDENAQVVFLSDALSALQALNARKLQQLEKALLHLNTLRTVIQQIPSHSGVEGNQKADSLAKAGAEQEQENNPVSLKEMNTFMKSIFKPSKKMHITFWQEQNKWSSSDLDLGITG